MPLVNALLAKVGLFPTTARRRGRVFYPMLQASVASPFRSHSVPVAQPLVRATRKLHTVVAFDLILPGLDSSGPRRVLQKALGDEARMQVVATDRRHEYVTLHVEVPSTVVERCDWSGHFPV